MSHFAHTPAFPFEICRTGCSGWQEEVLYLWSWFLNRAPPITCDQVSAHQLMRAIPWETTNKMKAEELLTIRFTFINHSQHTDFGYGQSVFLSVSHCWPEFTEAFQRGGLLSVYPPSLGGQSLIKLQAGLLPFEPCCDPSKPPPRAFPPPLQSLACLDWQRPHCDLWLHHQVAFSLCVWAFVGFFFIRAWVTNGSGLTWLQCDSEWVHLVPTVQLCHHCSTCPSLVYFEIFNIAGYWA